MPGLQWGRGNLAPESRYVRQKCTQNKRLQWGRGNLAPERYFLFITIAQVPKASMGPGQFSPGEVAYVNNEYSEEQEASMGPGQFSPGENARSTRSSRPGSCFNGAGAI